MAVFSTVHHLSVDFHVISTLEISKIIFLFD